MRRYSKQFFLSKENTHFDDFECIEVGALWRLYVHLMLTRNVYSQNELGGVLLGDVVDHKQPEASSYAILSQLVTSFCEGKEAHWSHLDRLSGRFVVFLWSSGRFHIYHDAFSSKPVYYSPVSECIGSHPALLASICN